MAYTSHNPRVFFDAIVTQLASSTGKNIGEAQAPASVVLPYAVIYPLSDEAKDGSLSNPVEIAVWAWQVTCVGSTMDQAQWMQHKVRQALLGWTPTVAGLGTTPVDLLDGAGVTRDDSIQPPLFYSTDRFHAYTSA